MGSRRSGTKQDFYLQKSYTAHIRNLINTVGKGEGEGNPQRLYHMKINFFVNINYIEY